MFKKKNTQVFLSSFETHALKLQRLLGLSQQAEKKKKKAQLPRQKRTRKKMERFVFMANQPHFTWFGASLQRHKEGKSHLNQFLMKPRTPGCSYRAAHLS